MHRTYSLSVCLHLSPPLLLLNRLSLFRVPQASQAPQAHLAYLGFQENQELMFLRDPLDLLERMELLANLGPP